MHKNNLLTIMTSLFLFLFLGTANAQCPNSYTINPVYLPSCPTASNGYLNLNYTTYYQGATYQWSNGGTTRWQTGLAPGHYSVTVTDPTTCVYVDAFYLPPSPVGLNVNTSFSSCNQTLSANVSGASTWPYTYLWSDGSTNGAIQAPNPGIYSVTITDADGCSGVGSHTVIPYGAPISVTHTATPATCNNSDGSIDLTVSGGLAPYTFTWYYGAQGNTTEDVTAVPVGRAAVQIRDANNCYFWYELDVPGPDIDVWGYHLSCGQTNGSVVVNTQNMSNPTFLWSTGDNTPSITGLPAGGYGVTVTDGGCVKTDSVNIYDNGAVVAYIQDSTQGQGCEITELSVWGYGGAYGPSYEYNYLWNTGETTADIIVQPGVSMYIVTLTDEHGCTGVDTLDLNGSNGAVSFSAIIQDATCGNSDGAIDLTASGANSYLWSPTGFTTEDISGIAAGHHTVDVIGWNGCTYSETYAVGEFIEFTSVDASCGLNNGSASVQDYGMTNPTFLWSNGATTTTLSNLSAGDYYITVTNNSCVIIDTLVINDAGQISAGINAASTCEPEWITAVPTNGAAPYTFVWQDASTGQSIANPIPGNSYSVTITDANGCVDDAMFTVPNPPTLGATYNVQDATCNNKNGAIFLTITSGTLPLNYAWSLGSANVKNLHNIYPGQYSVNITDNNGCQLALTNIPVGGQTAINVAASITQVNASNTGGAIDITVNNVTTPSYSWSNGANTEDISNLSSGYYRVTITDAATGCTFTRNYYLPGPHISNPNIKIRGRVYDISGSGLCQGGLPLPYEMVRLQPSGQVRFTNSQGYYEFNVTTPGNYTVEYVNTSPGTTTVICPGTGSYVITGATQGACYNNNFYVTNPPVQDLKIDLWDYSLASPGFPYYTRIKYCNEGNTIMSNGTVEYDYNGLLGFKSITGYNSILTLHDIPNHKFNWSFTNLSPAECRWVDVKFTVPTNTALGTGLQGVAEVFPIAGDATPNNNIDGEYTTVVGSWDPNDKQVEPYHSGDSWGGGIIYETEEELEYTIRFQNTGTAPANFVIIRDTLDVNLLPETVREIDTKHDAEVTVENGNILVFTFNNIYLPDSSTDFDASIGFVRFKVNRVAGLPIGTQIENTAAIYFDFNAPVITNTPISIIGGFTSVIDVDNSTVAVETMPNPFDSYLTLKYTLEESSNVTVKVMNSVGQCVYTHIANQEQMDGVYVEQLQLDDLPAGMYLLSVETNKTVVTKKIVKKD